MPASSASSASRSAVSEVFSAGFTTTVQPQASAGAIFHMPIISGKFHGTIAADDAHRLAHRVGERVRPGRDDLSVDLVGEARVVGERVQHRRQVLAADRRDRLAGIEASSSHERVLVALDELGEASSGARPRSAARIAAPRAVERRARRANGGVHVGGAGLGDLCDDLPGGGIHRRELPAGDGRHAAATDQEVVVSK